MNSPPQTSPAFNRFVQLMKELQRRRAHGLLVGGMEERFETAMNQCRGGMTIAENEFIDMMAERARTARAGEPPPETFSIDASKPPYEVQCPVCHANAFALCRDKPKHWSRPGRGRFPKGAQILSEPHPARWEKWHTRPDLRSRALR